MTDKKDKNNKNNEEHAYSIDVTFQQCHTINGGGVLMAKDAKQAAERVKEIYSEIEQLKIIKITRLSQDEEDLAFSLPNDPLFPMTVH